MIENIQWIFFDVGSTLMNEELVFQKAMEEIAEKANVTYHEIYEKAIQYYKQNKKGDIEVAKEYNVKVEKWHNEFEKLYDNAIECLEKLSKKYNIGIIANQPLGTEKRLANSGIKKYIDLVISSAEEGVKKPDKRIFEIALERSKCKPHNAVMVGDRIDNDIVPAKKIGLKTIWIKQGFGKYWNLSEEEKLCTDYIVNNLMEITDIFIN